MNKPLLTALCALGLATGLVTGPSADAVAHTRCDLNGAIGTGNGAVTFKDHNQSALKARMSVNRATRTAKLDVTGFPPNVSYRTEIFMFCVNPNTNQTFTPTFTPRVTINNAVLADISFTCPVGMFPAETKGWVDAAPFESFNVDLSRNPQHSGPCTQN